MAEAEAALLAAAKCLKSGWFKKPDHEAAASEYEKAATAFRTVKAYPRAVDAFCKASAEHEQFDSGFMACKHLETAAFLAGAGGLKQPAQSADLYERSVALHRQDGRVENACEALGKAARVLEPVDMARGAALAIAACDLYDEEISGSDVRDILLVNALEAYKLAVPLLLRAGRAAAAAGLLRRQVKVHVRVEQPHNVARCELSAVVCLLVADDYAAAATACDAAQLTGEGFSGTYEAEAAAELLEAFASQDAERVAAALANQTLSMLDHQIAQAARKLSLRSVGVPRDLVRLQGGGSGGGGSGTSGGLERGAARLWCGVARRASSCVWPRRRLRSPSRHHPERLRASDRKHSAAARARPPSAGICCGAIRTWRCHWCARRAPRRAGRLAERPSRSPPCTRAPRARASELQPPSRPASRHRAGSCQQTQLRQAMEVGEAASEQASQRKAECS